MKIGILPNERGVSIIELIFAVAIVATVVTAIYQMFYFAESSWAQGEIETQQSQAASVAITSMSRALRGIVAPSPSLSPIEAANENEIDSDEKPERVHYSIRGGDLILGVVEPNSGPPWMYGGDESAIVVARSLVNDAQYPLFRYYDENGAEITPISQFDRDRIRVIRIAPRVLMSRSAKPTQLTTDIAPRNMRSR